MLVDIRDIVSFYQIHNREPIVIRKRNLSVSVDQFAHTFNTVIAKHQGKDKDASWFAPIVARHSNQTVVKCRHYAIALFDGSVKEACAHLGFRYLAASDIGIHWKSWMRFGRNHTEIYYYEKLAAMIPARSPDTACLKGLKPRRYSISKADI